MLACTTILIDVLFDCRVNDATPYTPKSRRLKCVQWLKSWLKTLSKGFSDSIDKWEQLVRTRKRYKHRQRMANRLLTKGPRRPAPSDHRRVLYQTIRSLLVYQVLAMQAKQGKHLHSMNFDTDSGEVGIDNRCSACMSHDINDFVGQTTPTDRVIKGFGGTRTYNVQKGTIRWRVLDDAGVQHTFDIPDSYYVPSGNVRLLSPQHWAKHTRPFKKRSDANCTSTGTSTTHDKVVMYWQDRRRRTYTKTIPLDPNTNVATFDLAPSFTKYEAFCAEAGIDDNQDVREPLAFDTNMVRGDGDSDDDNDPAVENTPSETLAAPHEFDLNMTGTPDTQSPVHIEDDEEDCQHTNIASEFLRYHLRFGHCSPRKIQAMAKQGLLPRRLATCPIPICSACQFGKASKRQWRTKTAANAASPAAATLPGQVVSVDQLISRTPGLIAQLAGTLTHARYTCATVFVDHYSSLGYVHLQKSTSAKDTLEAKEAFERFAATNHVPIRHYHADNGIFAAHEWEKACREQGQGLTFAGVNAHHQNGKAEARIKHLQEMARTSMIHAYKRWPDAVSTYLWPYAVKMANDSINLTLWLQDKEQRTPFQMFSNTDVHENPKHWYHFGCPVYVLDDQLQAGKVRPRGGKWQERARINFTLVDRRSTRETSHLCSTSPLDEYRRSFTSKWTPCSIRSRTLQGRNE